MIGIIGAMKIEVEIIEAALEEKQERKIGLIRFISGKLNGVDTVAAVCGIGKVAAAICAQTMILEYSPDCIINTGVGGSLDPSLNIGDVLIADDLCQHDMDTSPIGDERGLISGLNLVYIPTDRKVTETLLKSAGDVRAVRGRIATGDQFVADDRTKAFIADTFKANVCEMEGASIAQVCYSAGVPFGVVRAVSDCADGSSHMDYNEFLPAAAKNAAVIIKRFVKIY
ncbi:MAG: 5'-methylthioadenosine/adenosylhomocysteine nucleosidase [Clostridia bacterium]|nr:5'-methylthioadenosine/adenosylhomocysteine nucleosidase [Clostridia bacterium]